MAVWGSTRIFIKFGYFYFKILFFYFGERMWSGEGAEEEERKFETDSVLSVEPDQGSILQSWDHDPNQNQELDAKPTNPCRHPPEFGYF